MIASTLLCLAIALHKEARGEPLAGQVAVASVIMHRVELNDSDTCSEIAKPGQFPWAKHLIKKKHHDYFLQEALPQDRTWKSILDLAAKIMDGTQGLSKNLVAFHNVFEHPRWKLRYAYTIGNHRFYSART